MEEVERSSERTLKGVRSSERDPAIFLTNGGTKEKGNAALRKETLQLKESKKASKDKDVPKRPAVEITVSSWPKSGRRSRLASADHKITNVIMEAGERWKSLLADERQKMDAREISFKFKHSQYDDDAIEIERCNLEGRLRPTRNVIQTMHEHRWLSPVLVERDDFKDETCTENLWPIAACAATFALAELRAGNERGCRIWRVFPQFLDPNRDSINNRRFQLRSRTEAKEFLHFLFWACDTRTL